MCVVGAGLAGLSTAYRLTREGVSVVVVDDGPIGVGQTGRTTAHLSNAIDDLYQTIEKIHGRDGARPAAESHTAAVDAIESIAAVEGIPFDFERLDGYLVPAPGESPGLLRRERDAARRAGLAIPILTLYERDEEREDAFEAIGAVRELLAMSIC